MERWVKLKDELGISQDYHFSRKILEYLEENVDNLKKTKKPKIKGKENFIFLPLPCSGLARLLYQKIPFMKLGLRRLM
jgi:hypothetical protein